MLLAYERHYAEELSGSVTPPKKRKLSDPAELADANEVIAIGPSHFHHYSYDIILTLIFIDIH